MSPCGDVPRFGTVPKLGENVRLSEVRFSSRMLSLETGMGSTVGVWLLSGRKMVLKPLPTHSPTNAASGPRLGGGVLAPLVRGDGRTSPNRKPLGSEIVAVNLTGSLIVVPPRFERTALGGHCFCRCVTSNARCVPISLAD